ncbi:MAG TPA: hypothetical protein VFI71_01440, partial [Pyrinomonadaceae bacterium]|nr:hypothetical protein [Pyrinomonadaceae bacterium]
MTPTTDEQIFEDDVHCRIADCRKRLRSRRSTLRAQNNPPSQRLSHTLDEAFAVKAQDQLEEREEALIT